MANKYRVIYRYICKNVEDYIGPGYITQSKIFNTFDQAKQFINSLSKEKSRLVHKDYIIDYELVAVIKAEKKIFPIIGDFKRKFTIKGNNIDFSDSYFL